MSGMVVFYIKTAPCTQILNPQIQVTDILHFYEQHDQ